MIFGPRILEQAEWLATFSEQPGGITRAYLTAQHRAAGDYLLGLMRSAGMTADYDALGNVVGRYDGDRPDAPVLLTGSHLDSVRNAGRYDGVFGILSPIAAIARLHAERRRLPIAIEVVAFGDEEGVRFGVTLIGSKALAGRFDDAWLNQTDAAGIRMGEAIRAFGGDVAAIPALARDRRHYLAFIESHIEQGPVLLGEHLPVGVVTAINGGSRIRVEVQGTAGHAGTVPMGARRDALAAAVEFASVIETYALAHRSHLVATIGKFEVVGGGAINVIPGRVQFHIDVRSPDDAQRAVAVSDLTEAAHAIGRRRGVTFAFDVFFAFDAATCDTRLMQGLAAAIAAEGQVVRYLPSGAGHDAMSFDGVLPHAMLFVRCGNGGISHDPAETLSAADAEIATRVLLRFFECFDPALLQ